MGVLVKPLLAAIGVKIIHLALVLAGSAGLLGRLLCHFQAAYRVFDVFCRGLGLGNALLSLGFLVHIARRILVKLLIAVISCKNNKFSRDTRFSDPQP